MRALSGPHDSAGRALLVLATWGGLAVPSKTAAAQARSNVAFLGTLAVGTGDLGFSGLVSGAVERRPWVVSLRITGNYPPAGRPVASDLGLLVGYARVSRHTRLAVGAGVSWVQTGDSSRTYGAPFNPHTLAGWPIQAEVIWRPMRGIGFGAFGVADMNARRSFWSLQCGLQLGGSE